MKSDDALDMVTGWMQEIIPVMEEYLGPIPEFYVMENEDLYNTHRVPWAIDAEYINQKWLIYYDPKRLAKYFTKPKNAAELLLTILHELAHIYQMEPLRIRLNKNWGTAMWDEKCARYWHWVEGAAQLSSIELYADLFRQQAHLKQILDKMFRGHIEFTTDEIITKIKHEISDEIGSCIAQNIQHKSLTPDDIDTEIARFNLPKNITQLTRRIANKEYRDTIYSNYNLMLSYSLGTVRCSRIVDAGFTTLPELLRTPVSNRKLLALSRSL